MCAKLTNKKRLAALIQKHYPSLALSCDSLFDVQVKRIHEYKRQLLNILGIIHRYLWIKKLPLAMREKVVPKVCIMAGKAAPGYYAAKQIIKFVNHVAEVINNDRGIGDLLKVVFLPNYGVSMAEIIIPGNDISQHTSPRPGQRRPELPT
jgi:starch phosphorylase